MAKTANKPESGTPPQGNTNVTPPAGETAQVAGNETPGQESTGNADGDTVTLGPQTPDGEAKPGDNQPTPESGTPPQGNTNVTPPAGETAQVAGNETPGQEIAVAETSGAANGQTAGKKKIRRPGKAGKKLFVGDRLIEFDAEGAAELDGPEAAILLGLNCGYEEA
ncbi:MAG: hypothetical protein Pg6C_16980 [Treponemataceae bacterium]|nr:MAG: hypothetical protein Pg6C_16980 [Treponemataceae bacterium]